MSEDVSSRVCTWEECTATATTPQIAQDGVRWADLCEKHTAMLDSSLTAKPFSPKTMFTYWIKAQGGAAVTGKRIFGAMIND